MTKLNVKEWSSKLVGKKIARDRPWLPTNTVSTNELPALTRFKGGSFDGAIWDDSIRSDRLNVYLDKRDVVLHVTVG